MSKGGGAFSCGFSRAQENCRARKARISTLCPVRAAGAHPFQFHFFGKEGCYAQETDSFPMQLVEATSVMVGSSSWGFDVVQEDSKLDVSQQEQGVDISQ